MENKQSFIDVTGLVWDVFGSFTDYYNDGDTIYQLSNAKLDKVVNVSSNILYNGNIYNPIQ